jgi:AcrR family transcriptional regulator
MQEGGERPRRSRRDERKEETRAELIAAAARAFARRGLHGASLERIAREAGYSTGAIYWHFADKDDLFLAVFEHAVAGPGRDLDALSERVDGDLPQRVRAYADQFMERLDRDPEFLVLTLEFLVHAWRDPKLREAFGHRLAGARVVGTRLLEEDAREYESELPMPAESLVTVFRELGTGLGIARLADPDAVPNELFGDFVELFFNLAAK